ncbi:MAG TPA: hypothetical protein VFU97_22055 [Xanthobacteraceae bacterium]|nr:hypothetical protein [Xanthobacteraceae bacterium]
MNGSTKFEYQTKPCASGRTSCGAMVARGRAYSVMMTRVARPFGRGRVLSGKVHVGDFDRFTVAR